MVYTRISATLKKDSEKHNQQYPIITLVENHSSHDRFIIIDNTQLYHIGASLTSIKCKFQHFLHPKSVYEYIFGVLYCIFAL
jgi:hypothetical protein